MSQMTIKVELLAGTDLEEAVKEAKQKAEKLDLKFVAFDFNGVSFCISRNADVDHVLGQFDSMCNSNLPDYLRLVSA